MSENTCYDERRSDDIQLLNNEASCELRITFDESNQKIMKVNRYLIGSLLDSNRSNSPYILDKIKSLVAIYQKKHKDECHPQPFIIFSAMFSSGLPMEVPSDALIGREDNGDMILLLITEALFKEAGEPVPDSIYTALREISQKLSDDAIPLIKTSFEKSAQLRAERGAKLVVDLPNINNHEQTGMDQCV